MAACHCKLCSPTSLLCYLLRQRTLHALNCHAVLHCRPAGHTHIAASSSFWACRGSTWLHACSANPHTPDLLGFTRLQTTASACLPVESTSAAGCLAWLVSRNAGCGRVPEQALLRFCRCGPGICSMAFG